MRDVVGFGALIKRKRGEARLTQEGLAESVFGDPTRKSDISRIENGKLTPQEATIQRLCKRLNITEDDLAPFRTGRVTAKDLDSIPGLPRDDLELLAARFKTPDAHDLSDAQLREALMQRAQEYRDYRQTIDALDDRVAAVANLKGAAQDAADRLDFDAVEELLSRVDEVETDIAAATKVARAKNALLQHNPDRAYTLLSAAADSYASVSETAPSEKRLEYGGLLRQYGLWHGGMGLALAAAMNREGLADIVHLATNELSASLQNSLAIALRNQGSRTEGSAGTDLLAQAVTAYRAGLAMFTRKVMPVQWALMQNNLAVALQEQGIRTEGAAGTDLLAQAVTVYRAVLAVHTRADMPVQWAGTQNNLGNALSDQGERTVGAAGADLLAQAVTAYRAALEVRTRADMPTDWATTQNNLASALQNQGIRTENSAGVRLLEQAVIAYHAALEVHTRVDMPVNWAMTQENLAIVEIAHAEHDSCDDPRGHLEAALAHVEAALTVYDPEHMSYDYGTATKLQDKIQAALTALN